MTKTHWKKLQNPDYIGAYDFAEGETERIVTIKEVKREVVTGTEGKKEECTVAYFKENYKPMILNATNQKMITKLAETPYVEEWTGLSFKLYVTKVRSFGEMVDALRIRSEKVTKTKPTLELNTENFNKCRESYLADSGWLPKIKAKYEVSAQVEAELTKPANTK